jgi:hypothetical protein|tara:strand:- start:3021 stop:3212 length:192 start_codon:yes stop_codon:yes gene_type:complete
MEIFASFVVITTVVFFVITIMGMWATGVFGDEQVAAIKRQHKREEKLARERERHIRAMVAARK